MVTVGTIASNSTNLTIKSEPLAANRTYAQMGINQAEDVATQTISFDDFLDAINPFQHIPVLSSVYRAISGESINPVSRIAGDALYGGIFGLASAAMSGVGALADEVVAAGNEGESASEFLVASLFGSDGASTQIADAAASPAVQNSMQATSNVALLQTPATQSPILHMPDLKSVAQTTEGAEPKPSEALLADGAAQRTLPLDRSKLAYGGVMDSSMMASAQQNQALALALAGNRNVMQEQRALRSNRFETEGPSPENEASRSEANASALQALLKDLQLIKSTDHYKNAAQNAPTAGSTVNIVN